MKKLTSAGHFGVNGASGQCGAVHFQIGFISIQVWNPVLDQASVLLIEDVEQDAIYYALLVENQSSIEVSFIFSLLKIYPSIGPSLKLHGMSN